jgi:hypothetical protein
MRRLLAFIALLAVPAQAQYLTPADAGAAIEAQLAPLWATGFRQCQLDWYAGTHPNGTTSGEFAQCVNREAFASIAVISRDDVALPSYLPPNINHEPTDRPGMSCGVIFKACIADIDTLPRGFQWRADVYQVPENHPGYPGDFAGWGWDLTLCFAWDEDKDSIGDELWCKTQGEGNDPVNNNTGWVEVTLTAP